MKLVDYQITSFKGAFNHTFNIDLVTGILKIMQDVEQRDVISA